MGYEGVNMAKIEVTCPECGPVTCTGASLQLRTLDNADAFYVFECPACGLLVQRPADARAVRILLEEGVVVREDHIPKEFFEVHDGPAFTVDDLIEFHRLLEQPEWYRAVLR